MSDSISDSREVHWMSLLFSPKLVKEAMRAITEATGCEIDPECGVPRVITPATLFNKDMALLDVFSDNSKA